MQIVTKFNLGDVVFGAGTSWSEAWERCVPCAGTGSVAVVTQQESHPTNCPYCCDFGMNSRPGYIRRYDYHPKVQALTVGQINTIHRRKGGSREAECVEERYMMVETGVGSGTMYDADRLFGDRVAAEACSARLTEVARAERDKSEADRVAAASKKALRKKGG